MSEQTAGTAAPSEATLLAPQQVQAQPVTFSPAEKG